MQEAIHKLTHLTGLKLDFEQFGRDSHEFIVTIENTISKTSYTLHAIIKNEVRMIPPEIAQIEKRDTSILIANYITAPVKDKLKENNINYLELAGNCFIRTGPFFIYINDQKTKETRERATGKLWTPTGLKFIWSILQDPAILNATYRTQATVAGIALGRVGDLLLELQQLGYIHKNRDGNYFLQQQEHLQNKWIELYTPILRPKLLYGTYRQAGKNFPLMDLPNEMLWGNESAAARMFPYLEAEKLSVYTWQNKIDTIKQLRLIPDPSGPIELLEGFWPLQKKVDQPFVPPIMVYAELIGTGDSRNLETAQRLKALNPQWKW